MTRTTLKELRNLVSMHLAKDITNYTHEEITAFLRRHDIDRIMYSFGTYGTNGALVRDRDTGELFAITARSATLFCVL